MQKKMDMPETFKKFLAQVDQSYKEKLAQIPLFDSQQTANWNLYQKSSFAAIFYHLRGHFINFMWYVANFAPDEATKTIIINNISEELGVNNKFSHEMLYAVFAKENGINIHDEIVNQTHYLPFAQNFNKEHLAWLASHDAESQISAFAAYERLDNIDYPYLTACVASLNTSDKGITFFKVHSYVEHFSATIEKLLPIWNDNSIKIKEAFDFIYTHQLRMWQQLSDEIFSV